MVLLVIFVVVTVILLCCVYFVVASLLFHAWLYVCVYVPTRVLHRSGKEERPWPISGAKINNQSINHQSLTYLPHLALDQQSRWLHYFFPIAAYRLSTLQMITCVSF